MIEWIMYAAAMGVAACVVAEAAHRLLLAIGKPLRCVWLAAMAATLILPATLPFIPQSRQEVIAPETFRIMLTPAPPAPHAPDAPAAPTLPDWASIFRLTWIAVSAALIAYTVLALARLRVMQRAWRHTEISGQAVLVSSDTGPAVVGVLAPRIVVPSWFEQLRESEQRLVLEHEREHIRARDSLLIALAQLATLAVPWNLALWYQRRRLREAVELDCDARLLARGHSRSGYAALLLSVGQRASSAAIPLAAMAEPRSLLEKRVRRLLEPARPSRLGSAAWLAVAALAVMGAAQAPRPEFQLRDANFSPATLEPITVTQEKPLPQPVVKGLGIPPASKTAPPQLKRGVVPAAQGAAAQRGELRNQYAQWLNALAEQDTVRPELQNARDVIRRLQDLYPPALRDAGIGGMAVVWLYVDTTGLVTKVQLKKSSGREALDDVALKLTDLLRFTPARLGNRKIAMWTELPYTFAAGEPTDSVRARMARAQADDNQLHQQPVFTPYTVAPGILNQTDVVRAIQRLYPPLLRDGGVGGTVLVWFLLDEQGNIMKTQLKKPSGHNALDDAALKVAWTMKFSPALNRDQAVKVWIELPIVFRSPNSPPQEEGQVSVTSGQALFIREAIQKHFPNAKPNDGQILFFLVTNRGEVVKSAANPAARGTQRTGVDDFLYPRGIEEIERISVLKGPTMGDYQVVWIQLK